MTYFEWYPPNGDAQITFKEGTNITATAIDGLGQTYGDPQTVKAPAQYGETAIDLAIGPRTIAMTLAIEMTDHSTCMAMRNKLARAMFVPPRSHHDLTAPVQKGILRIYRDGLTVIEIEAIPRNSPQINQVSDRAFVADIELYCGYPYYRELADQYLLLQASGGFTWPVTFPLAMSGFNITLNVPNTGDVPVPVLLRMNGQTTTTRFRNLTTGEDLEFSGTINSGEYIEVNTEFGNKKAELVNATTFVRTNVMSRVNLNKADFWWLQPGNNIVAYEADTNTSGYGQLYYRPRYAGI